MPADAAVEISPAAHRRAVLVLVGAALVAFAVDLITKVLAIAHLDNREPVRLLGGLIYLTFTRNAGAAFSIGTGLTWVFPIITVLVVGVIIWLSRRLASVPWAIALGLIVGGALGNLADRLFRAPGPLRGHVVDFISFLEPSRQAFPIWNMADTALTCGVVLAILLELMGRRREGGRISDRPQSTDDAPSAGRPEA